MIKKKTSKKGEATATIHIIGNSTSLNYFLK